MSKHPSCGLTLNNVIIVISQNSKMAAVSLLVLAALILLSEAQSSPDGSHSSICNSCCQGPAGLNGVPGVPGSAGSNGLHGRDGSKGEAGLKGERGEVGSTGEHGPPGPRGPIGDRGERGEQGLQGLPGKVGPRGLDGRPGPDGRLGPIGPKGSKGDSTEVRKSAFSVYKTSSQTGNSGDVLTFQVDQTNVGSHYNIGTDKFTCQIAGTYVFMFTIASNYQQHDPSVKLVKDGSDITRVHIRDGQSSVNNFHQSSNMAILQLAVGNQVWLQFANSGEQVYSDSSKWVSFSGFLLYAE